MTAPLTEAPSDRYEIRLSGSGGQGIILASVILAEALALHEQRQVAQTQSYGPEARGGRCKAEVVVSDRPIDYPKVIKVDLLLAMTQEACDAYSHDFKSDGLLLVDSTFVEQVPTSRAVAIPFTRIAREQIGNAIAANMTALGAIAVFCPLVTAKSLEKALLNRVPAGTKALNRQAFRAGVKAAGAFDLAKLPRAVVSDEDEEI